MFKKISDLLVFIFCMIACVVIVYFGVCYLNIVTHNLDSGYEYPQWNKLAITIENLEQ